VNVNALGAVTVKSVRNVGPSVSIKVARQKGSVLGPGAASDPSALRGGPPEVNAVSTICAARGEMRVHRDVARVVPGEGNVRQAIAIEVSGKECRTLLPVRTIAPASVISLRPPLFV